MKKIMVIGCPGSGKSRFSKALHEQTGVPLYHLDMMYWNADKTIVERSVFLERQLAAIAGDAWIVDGNYGSTMELRLEAADTVFFLDYPLDVCLDGVRERRGKPRSDMPWIETEEDAEFMEYIRTFGLEQRPQILALLAKYTQKRIVIFTSRDQADTYLTAYATT